MKLGIRAELFRQLAVMEDAGLPFDKALEAVHLPPSERPRLKAARKWIGLGLGIAEAGLKCGLFTPLEASLVRAATLSGSPARTYRLIADRCARRAARVKAIRSRMTLPAVVLAMSIVLGPVPSLVAGTLTVTGYVMKDLLPWIGLGVAAYLLLALARRRQSSAGPPFWDGALPWVPLFGPMEVRRNLRDFFDGMAMLLEAGVPMAEAVPVALQTVRNQVLRQRLARIGPRVAAGGSFAQALAEVPLHGQTQACGMIRTGESSGTLPRTLFRYAEAEGAAIGRFDDLVAEWLPRLAYALVVLLVSYRIIHGWAIMQAVR